MQFLFPTFLFALLAIAIPILIYLYNFRQYKTVYFSHVDFLKEIKKDSRKKTKLKQLLILIARVLTITFLVFAFAQPYFSSSGQKAKSTDEIIGVYIDNSFSMNALSEKGQLLEQARTKAVEIAQLYPSGKKFKLFTNDMHPKHQYLFNKEQFIREVGDVKTSPAIIPLSRIHNLFEVQNKNSGDNMGIIYFISDFQRNITDLDNFTGELVSSYFLKLTPTRVNNLYIDSCWVEVPAHGLNREENIFIKITNNSDEDYENLPLKLYLNDSLKSIANFSVAANDENVTLFKYTNSTAGIQLGKFEITDYPFTHDNTWYISYFVEPKMKALGIYSNNSSSLEGLFYLSALFQDDDYVSFEKMDIQNLQISKLAENNTIFLIGIENFSTGFLNELSSAVANGSSVVLFPKTEGNIMVNNNFLSKFNSSLIIGIDSTKQDIGGIDLDNPFYENVFHEKKENAVFPQIGQHLKFEKNTRSAETNLLWFQNGDKALSEAPLKNGKVWVFSFTLDKSNESFARDILFVPTIYNIVMNSTVDQKISYILDKDMNILLPKSMNINKESLIEIENRETGNKFIPETIVTKQGTRMDLSNLIENAGHYIIKNREEILTSLAFNYDRRESDLRYFTNEELIEKVKNTGMKNSMVINEADRDFGKIFEQLDKDKQLWKLCIILSLLFILAEVLITRFWKQ